jgi:23S rRNA (uracil1939-C5)-methyltransferase
MKREVDDIIAASPWGYRRRARLSLNYQPKTQQLQMGFRRLIQRDRRRGAVPHFGAHLEALPAVRECLSGLKSPRQLGHVELVLADNGPLMVLRHTAALPAAIKKNWNAFRNLTVFRCTSRRKARYWNILRGSPWYTSDGLRLTFSPRDFIQVNDGVNQQMVQTALAWLDIQPQDRVLDLFCGMGNFTLPLATRAASVVGVEGVPALVEKGRENAR